MTAPQRSRRYQQAILCGVAVTVREGDRPGSWVVDIDADLAGVLGGAEVAVEGVVLNGRRITEAVPETIAGELDQPQLEA
jgi:hypothetical protein